MKHYLHEHETYAIQHPYYSKNSLKSDIGDMIFITSIDKYDVTFITKYGTIHNETLSYVLIMLGML